MAESDGKCIISSFFSDDNDENTIPLNEKRTNSPNNSINSSQHLSQSSVESDDELLSLLDLTLLETPLNIQPFYNITPRAMPVSPHVIFEEEFSANPWALLIATIFLNKTAGRTARRYIRDFFEQYPTPYHVLDASPKSLEYLFVNLGLKKRGHMIWKLSYQFVSAKWRRVSDLYGIGKYGEDAYRIFCLGHTDISPGDRYLNLYLDWLRNQTNYLMESGEEESNVYITDLLLNYYIITLKDSYHV